MDLMFGWEEGDRFSFEDSDHFEEDSLCSWISEPESLCNNWRGWKKQNGQGGQQQGHPFNSSREEIPLRSLVELAAREVACHIPFEVVEHVYPPVPEQLQLRIAFWSFPENEEDIRLYSCLANGSADEFQRGEHLLKAKSIRDPLQIGFHLSATVVVPPALGQSTKGSHNVAVTFDRRRITSCNCTCTSTASWCAHVVAVCLYRIIYPNSVCLRAPVSESLGRLHRDQLQKFAQYLISELPQQILPTAQRLLDELLSSQATAINTVCGAPDPTAGPSANEQTAWCLDEATLHENIRKMLIKFCVPSPIVFSDVNYLSSTAPPAAAEWSSLLRPLRGREPEGMWSLLSIVREMYRRSDRNAIPLLEILTEECLACEQILIWWFNTKVTLHNNGSGLHGNRNSGNSSTHTSQHACSSLCDEIVLLWRLAALNPAFSPKERTDLKEQLQEWHIKAIEKVCKAKSSSGGNGGVRKTDIEIFTGFKPAIEACLLDWNDFPIEGITYNPSHANKRWHQFYMRPHTGDHRDGSSNQTSGNEHPPPIQGTAEGRTRTPRSCLNPPIQHVIPEHRLPVQKSSSNDYNRSSLSSEGFCENDVAEILAQAKEYGESSFIDDIDVLSEHDSQDLRDDKELEPSISTEIIVVMASPDKPDKVKNKEKTRSPTKVSIVQAKTSCHVSDEGNFTDKEKSSPEDLDSDWSSAPESHCKTLKPVRTERKEDKYDPSESQQSSDEYQVYYYDTKAKVPQIEKTKEKLNEENSLFANIKKIDDKMEILYARAEALHAHGHTKEACKLAVQLAEELLANPPDLLREPPPPPVKPGKRKKAMANHSISQLATATLTKVAFLVTVLSEEPDYHHLAFKVGMFGLEMPRPPASSKALEVKLANQESDLVVLLKRIPLGPAELNVIHERAEQLKEGKLKSRGEALLPLMLATFIFDALCLPGSNNLSSRCNFHSNGRLPTDPQLGFDAAVTALGLKANVSEADHPLLCEGTRRQRGELAISLLVQYKDDQEKLVKIMDKLLDKEVHQMYKAPSLSAYYTTKSTPHHQTAPVKHAPGAPESHSGSSSQPKKSTSSESEDNHQPGTSGVSSNPSDLQGKPPSTSSHHEKQDGIILEKSLMGMNISSNRTGARAKEASHRYNQRLDDNLREDTSSPTWEEDYKAWEAKFRCTNLKTHKRHSAGMASIDSSAPETTSSDNSPTLIRRSGWGKPTGPGSDSGSSGKSSDSLGSSSSGDKVARSKIRENESPTSTFGMVRFASTTMMDSLARSSTPCIKTSRFKGKRVTPSIPNQPSEASAHFMVELAKTVLTKAGGNSSTSLFTQPSTTQSHSGPHRALHMCAFQIGLYALGLHNCVSPNWLSRTYSSHVSWITGQAMEIGSAAITFLIDTWEGHLTPPEVASLADRASRGRDPNMVRAAAELALSCLPHAHALNPNEIQRALIQCKEQSNQMLERACLAVESAAKGGGVYPEVLYDVARRWYELYEESMLGPSHNNNAQENIIPAQENLILPEQPLVFDPNVIIPVERVSPPNMQVIATQPPNNNITVTIPPPPFPLPQPLPVTQVHYSYSFVPQMPNFGPHYTQPPLAFHTHNIHPAYITAPYAYTGQTFTNIHPMHPPNPQPYYQNGSQIRPGPSTVYSSIVVTTGQNRLAPTPQMPQMTHPTHQVTPVANQLTQAQLNYVLNAYRVGMLATETLARRVHDDRPQAKYARNPPYGEDLKWLLGVAKKLGSTHLQQFCISALNSVVSPFILHDIAIEAAHYLGSNSPAPTPQHLRSPVLSPLVQKCLQMYIQCTHQKIHHITPAEYDEFVSIIRSARNAFQMTPSGMVQFNELLQSLRRTKSCKKELWQRIMNGLAMANM